MRTIFALLCLACLRLHSATINITAGFPFSPSSVTVTVGDTIHWQSLSGHNVTETNDPLPGAAAYNGTGFHSACCAAGTFDWVSTAGNHTYFCEFHGGFSMYGHIFVQPAPTDTPTPDGTFTVTPTPNGTFTATPTASPSCTVTPVFPKSGQDKSLFAPVPLKAGQPLCLYFSSSPVRNHLRLFNSKGELVASRNFANETVQCLETQNLAPGLYFAHIEEIDASERRKKSLQKIVITP